MPMIPRPLRAAGASAVAVALMVLATTGDAMTETATPPTIVIRSERGTVTAVLADNAASRALRRQLPVTLAMRDHLRQEMTGRLPAPLPEAPRQLAFHRGLLGLWSDSDVVIYTRDGRVPAPGLVVLGEVQGDVAAFDADGPVTVTISEAP
jgi:hypothetical protein